MKGVLVGLGVLVVVGVIAAAVYFSGKEAQYEKVAREAIESMHLAKDAMARDAAKERVEGHMESHATAMRKLASIVSERDKVKGSCRAIVNASTRLTEVKFHWSNAQAYGIAADEYQQLMHRASSENEIKRAADEARGHITSRKDEMLQAAKFMSLLDEDLKEAERYLKQDK